MRSQLQILNRRSGHAALSLLASFALAGCAGGGQERREVPYWSLYAPQTEGQPDPLMSHSGNSGAVIFAPGAEAGGSFYAYERDLAPEYARRDGALAVSEADATAGWYAWPEQARPSLDDQGRFYTSSNPNVYVYPGGEDRRYSNPYGRRDSYRPRRDHGHRGNDYPRRRVR